MIVNEIDPFIRYAKNGLLHPFSDFGYAVDWRLFYIFKGSCILCIGDSVYELKPFSIVIIPPNNGYRFSKIKDVSGVVLNFDMNQENAENEQPCALQRSPNELFEQTLSDKYSILNIPVVLYDYTKAQNSALEIAAEFELRKLYFHEQTSAKLKSILIDLIRFRVTNNCVSEKKAEMILRYINTNYNSNFNCKNIADVMHYHPNYLNKLIKIHTGETLKNCIINARINAAKQLLISTDLPIISISVETGFSNPAYFSNCFKKKTGLTPAEFRKHNNETI